MQVYEHLASMRKDKTSFHSYIQVLLVGKGCVCICFYKSVVEILCIVASNSVCGSHVFQYPPTFPLNLSCSYSSSCQHLLHAETHSSCINWSTAGWTSPNPWHRHAVWTSAQLRIPSKQMFPRCVHVSKAHGKDALLPEYVAVLGRRL